MAAKKPKTNEIDFDALDRLAHSITPEQMHPLTAQQQDQWEAIKRGRSKKPPIEPSDPSRR
jgi:hypothetical protein